MKIDGITLIALVITIIVLLILAAVSITTLTGENGILTQAGKAKEETGRATAIEKVQVEVLGSYGTDGSIDYDLLNNNLRNISGLTYNGNKISEDDSNRINELPALVMVDGYDIIIDINGNVRELNDLEKAKVKETVFKENTIIKDAYGNSITIPSGFKIASDSSTDVTGGVVIEDVDHVATAGSQFVWIPVGTGKNAIKKSDGTTVEISLGRYIFDSSGNIDKTLSVTGASDQLKTWSSSSSYFTEGLKNEPTRNTHAKDIEAFINSVDNNYGYYIGRYEARKNVGGQLTEVGTDSVYDKITQSNAAVASQKMYENEIAVESDLMNSFAWDTSIVFLQTFDDRVDKTKPYSKQTRLNIDGLATQGTNELDVTTKQDKICNIWDMASNYMEWTTETSSSTEGPCVSRGGFYLYSYYTDRRGSDEISWAGGTYSGAAAGVFSAFSFRPILYVNK